MTGGHGWESRVAFWQIQVGRYSEEHMRAWLDALPLRIKPRF